MSRFYMNGRLTMEKNIVQGIEILKTILRIDLTILLNLFVYCIKIIKMFSLRKITHLITRLNNPAISFRFSNDKWKDRDEAS